MDFGTKIYKQINSKHCVKTVVLLNSIHLLYIIYTTIDSYSSLNDIIHKYYQPKPYLLISVEFVTS